MKAVFAIISVAPAIIEVRRAGMRQSRGVCSTALMRSVGQAVYIAERSIYDILLGSGARLDNIVSIMSITQPLSTLYTAFIVPALHTDSVKQYLRHVTVSALH